MNRESPFRALACPLLLCCALGTGCSRDRDSTAPKVEAKRAAGEQTVPIQPAPETDPRAQPQDVRSEIVSAGAVRLAPGSYGWTELMEAASKGDLARVQDLLARGADVNARDNSGLTALMAAANAAVAEALLAKGADVNAQGQRGMTALSSALMWNHLDVAEVLLAKGADPNAGGSGVLSQAVVRGQTAIVRPLLEKGADPNVRDATGNTPLLHAVEHRHGAAVEALLDKGADPNAKDRYGQPPLILAAERGDEAIVIALLRKGADPNAVAGLSAMGGTYDTALKRAAANGGTAVVRALLDGGADIDGKGSSGDTALMVATKAGREDVARLLLAKAATAAAKDKRREAFLLYFQGSGPQCALKSWSPADRAGKVLLDPLPCPDQVFFVEDTGALITVTGKAIQEILVKPAVKSKTPVPVPGADKVVLAGYLADGRLAVVHEKTGPADDSELSLFSLGAQGWNLAGRKNCGRFFTIGGCLGNQIRGRGWEDWGEETQIWHPKLALNPFVVSRGPATREGGRFVLDKRGASENEKSWGYVRFAVKDHQSILFHDSQLEQYDAGEAMETSSLYLQTYKDRSPVSIVEGRFSTAVEDKYLLFGSYPNPYQHLVDLETGEQPVEGLKFAFWAR
jgi:ankyrin repeat protein